MKNRTIALLVGIVFLLFSSSMHAQVTFERWYGGTNIDTGLSVVQTSDGGYIIAGATWSFGAGSIDVYLIKTDALGDTTWTKTYGGTDIDYGYSVAQTTDGGYIIAGTTESFGAGNKDVYLIKTDSSGVTIWTKTFGSNGSEYGYSVAQTTDGGYIIAGSAEGDVYLIKTDAAGDSLWAKTHGSTETDWGSSVAQTTDGGYIIAGWTMPFGMGSSNVYLIRTDSSGDTIWTKAYGDSTNSGGNSVAQTTDGGFIIAGEITPFNCPYVYLIKTDASGDTLWTRTFGPSGDWGEGYSVAQTVDGGYIVVGEIEVSVVNKDAYLIKTDATGDSLWAKTYGSTEPDLGNSVAQTTDGGYIIAGATWSFGAGSQDVYLIKTDSLGNVGVEESDDRKQKTEVSLHLNIVPNPFATEVRIQISEAWEKSDICSLSSDLCLHIFDASGRLVKSLELETSRYQLGADLSPGVYFLKLNDKPVGKVVKVR